MKKDNIKCLLEVYRETLGLSAKLLEAISQADRYIENLKADD